MIKIVRTSKEVVTENRELIVTEGLCEELKNMMVNNLENEEDKEKLSILTPRYVAKAYFDEVNDITVRFHKDGWFGYHSDSLNDAIKDIINEFLWEEEPIFMDRDMDYYEDNLEMTERGEQLKMDFMYQ